MLLFMFGCGVRTFCLVDLVDLALITLGPNLDRSYQSAIGPYLSTIPERAAYVL